MSLRRPRFEDEQPAQAINISPLIDVIFILLIFFIVTMVFADGSAMDLDIPSAANVSEVKADSVTVSISSDSSLYVDGKRYTLAALPSVLRGRLAPKGSVILRADEKVSVSALVAVMGLRKGKRRWGDFCCRTKKAMTTRKYTFERTSHLGKSFLCAAALFFCVYAILPLSISADLKKSESLELTRHL